MEDHGHIPGQLTIQRTLIIGVKQIDVLQQYAAEREILLLHADNIQCRDERFIGWPYGRYICLTTDCIKDEKICSSARCFAKQPDSVNGLVMTLHHIMIHVGFEIVLDRDPVLFLAEKNI